MDDERWRYFSDKRDAIEREKQRLSTTWVQPHSPTADRINAVSANPLSREYNLFELLKRPEVDAALLAELDDNGALDPQVAQQLEIEAKYAGYIHRQQAEIERLRENEETPIPGDFDYGIVKGLSNEVRQKLEDARPETLARASRIPGVTPAAVSLLLIYLKKQASPRAGNSADKIA